MFFHRGIQVVTVRPIPTEDYLVELYQSGRLAEELGAYHDGDAEGDVAFAQACAKAHNEGRIDLLAIVQQPAFAALESHAFFTAQQVYCNAIPHLKADVYALMGCCHTLVQRAGQDLASGMPNGAFREWCENNHDQAVRVIDDAKSGKHPAKDFVTFALQGVNDIEQAIAFVKHFSDERRLSGMTALGQMTFPDEDLVCSALAVLEPFADAQSDDSVRANAIVAALRILSRYSDIHTTRRIVEAAAREPGPSTVHALAEMLFQRRVVLDTETACTAMNAMREIRKDSPGTLRLLLNVLIRMLDTPEEALALDVLSEMLDRGEWSIEDFGRVIREISNGTSLRRHALAVKWLLSDSVRLGNAVSQLARYGQDEKFGFDMALPPLTDDELVVLCRKAVAFLFLQPKSCCGILVAVLRIAGEHPRAFAMELLVNPMMMSYRGAQEYLMTVPDTDPIYPHIQTVLERFSQHRAALDAIEDIKELYPSERQRNMVRVRSGDQVREAMKSAEKSSVLMNLVHRTHVLHGRRVLTFVDGPDGTRRAIPMDLNPHSTSIELPRLEWLDPVGIDYMRRRWSVERQS